MEFSVKDYLESLEATSQDSDIFFSRLADFDAFGAQAWVERYLMSLLDDSIIQLPEDFDEADYVQQLIDEYDLIKETSDWFTRHEDSLPIQELDEKLLNENIPPDLARAYKLGINNIRKKYEDTYTKLFDRSRRKDVQLDFYNSSYKEISAAEALKNYSQKGERSKLRVLFAHQADSDYMGLMMWTDDNDPIFSPSSIEAFVPGGVYSFKDIINSAYKIYVTDEMNNKIIKTSEITDKERDNNELLRSLYADTYIVADFVSRYTLENSLLPKDTVADSGGFRNMRHSYEYRQLKDIQARYKRYIDDVKAGKETNVNGKALLAVLHSAEARYLDRKATAYQSQYSTDNKTISEKLARLILLKYLANRDLKAASDVMRGNSVELAAHDYRRISDSIAQCNKQIKELAERIQRLQSMLTSDIKNDYNDLLAEKSDEAANKYLQSLAELNALRKEYGLPEESLDESLDKSYVRIFTVDKNGKESFVDDISSEDTAIEKAKAICDDYDAVYVVKIAENNGDQDIQIVFDSTECLEQNNSEDVAIEEDITKPSIGQIVDDLIKKESLKESKSFDIKDIDAVVDAVAYKNIPEDASNEIIVIDSDTDIDTELDGLPKDKAIIECTSCKSKILAEKESLKKDDTLDVYNLDFMCPHCGAYTGYHLISEEPKAAEELPADAVESELAPADVDYIDLDNIENVVEESFEKLASSYLNKLYENVESFKITSISQPSRKALIVEGDIVGTNGRTVATKFDLKLKENANHRVIFEALNNKLSDNDRAFQIVAKSENDSLLFESFSYKYTKNVDGNDILIEGIEK